ncbi:unnamed protein product [Thlaspi arvense]|uniref:Pentatricopeptide repeat-containing protein n=1 Tax=Thlaspi arvense TaxID=13288 RepID=A0AAU9S3B8_THLAR|nr:unnamed protein product [Thlaspi arvense]
MGFGSNVYITSALAYMYGKSGAVSSAQRVFDETLHRNAVTWNSLMSAYLHNQLPELAIKLFVEMLKEGIFPTAISFVNCPEWLCAIRGQRTGCSGAQFLFENWLLF